MAYGFATENHPKSQHWPKLVAAWFASVVLVAVLTACGAADESEGAGQPAEQQAGQPAATGAKQAGLEGVTAYAGTGDPRFSGDGGPASEAGFFAPKGLALDAEGNLLISTDNRIRKIDSSTGVITTGVSGLTGVTGSLTCFGVLTHSSTTLGGSCLLAGASSAA